MVFCYGKDSEYIYKTVSENGIDGFYSSDKNEVADALSQYVREGDIVLFKASRGMRLEEIITKVYGEEN
jgi:UDP-N-acetylmuramoyl-tripeptide--D-alanyl-D-alanine ligase